MTAKKIKSCYFIAPLRSSTIDIQKLEENPSLYANLTKSELLDHVIEFNRYDIVGPCNDSYTKSLKESKAFGCKKMGDIPFEYYKSNSEYETLVRDHIIIKRTKEGLYSIIPKSVLFNKIDKDRHIYDAMAESITQMTVCYDNVIDSIISNTKKNTSLINFIFSEPETTFNLVIMHEQSPDYLDLLNDQYVDYGLSKIPGTDCFSNLPTDKMKHRLMFAIISSSRQAEICSRTLDSSNYEEVFAYHVTDSGNGQYINFQIKQLSASEVYKISTAISEDLGYSPPLEKQIFCGPDISDRICGFDLI